jgi:hypothetical protein
MMKQPTAFLPVVMSLGALFTVLVQRATHGVAPQTDEGAAAHIFQLLLVAQAPIVAFFAIKWIPRAVQPSLYVLAVQVGAALAALAPVYFLRW